MDLQAKKLNPQIYWVKLNGMFQFTFRVFSLLRVSMDSTEARRSFMRTYISRIFAIFVDA
jgi:hypothetical protein